MLLNVTNVNLVLLVQRLMRCRIRLNVWQDGKIVKQSQLVSIFEHKVFNIIAILIYTQVTAL